MANELPLVRSNSTDKIYRVNTGSDRLMRMLETEYSTRNLSCFLPALDLWTEGQVYNVGDIVFGSYIWRTGYPPNICGIFECKIANIATQSNKPSGTSSFGGCVVESNLYWTAIGSTVVVEYPPCGTLAGGGAEPYGGINKSPTGVLVEFSGIQKHPDSDYYGPETAWHHDYNGQYVLPIGVGTSSPPSMGGLTLDPNGELTLSWGIEFAVRPSAGYGECFDTMPVVNEGVQLWSRKATIEDNWWFKKPIFCGLRERGKCETSYSLSSVLVAKPDPMPEYGSDEWDAFRDSTLPAKECLNDDSILQYYIGSGWGGSYSFLGFTDMMYVRLVDKTVTYDGTESANVRFRIALIGNSGVQKLILKSNIEVDFFRYDFNGWDWNLFRGGELIPLTCDSDGWFDYTCQRPGGIDICDFGVTNINAHNWKYLTVSSGMLGTIYGWEG